MIKNKKKNFDRETKGKYRKSKGTLEIFEISESATQKNSHSTICFEKDSILSFDPKTNAETFKDFYSNLTNDLVEKLPILQINSERSQLKNFTKV